MMKAPLDYVWLGCVGYDWALAFQHAAHDERVSGQRPDTLLLLEHPHTITFGRRGGEENLRLSPDDPFFRGVTFRETDRGGNITYHGPGQVVGYPIIDLRARRSDVVAYVRDLEEVIIRTLGRLGIESFRIPKLTGVWTSQGKIGAIGVRVSRWTTRHGFALNVTTDLRYFERIVPCGLHGKGTTSIERMTGARPAVREVAERLAFEFAEVFERRLVWKEYAREPLSDPDGEAAGVA